MELILTSLLRRITLSPWWAINMFNQSINLKQLIFESDFWIRWRFYSRGNLTSWEGETSLREIGLRLWKQGQGGNTHLFLSWNVSCPLNRFNSIFLLISKIAMCDVSIDKQMLEKVFCSNITPFLSSGYLFYKTEYNGTTLPLREALKKRVFFRNIS